MSVRVRAGVVFFCNFFSSGGMVGRSCLISAPWVEPLFLGFPCTSAIHSLISGLGYLRSAEELILCQFVPSIMMVNWQNLLFPMPYCPLKVSVHLPVKPICLTLWNSQLTARLDTLRNHSLLLFAGKSFF